MSVTITEQDILREVRTLIQFPNGLVCKHYAAANLLSMLERCGYPLTNELAAAVVGAEDDISIPLLDKLLQETK